MDRSLHVPSRHCRQEFERDQLFQKMMSSFFSINGETYLAKEKKRETKRNEKKQMKQLHEKDAKNDQNCITSRHGHPLAEALNVESASTDDEFYRRCVLCNSS